MLTRGLASQSLRPMMGMMPARLPVPPRPLRAVSAQALNRASEGLHNSTPWYLREDWASNRFWKRPTGSNAFVSEPTSSGGTFYRVGVHVKARLFHMLVSCLGVVRVMVRPHNKADNFNSLCHARSTIDTVHVHEVLRPGLSSLVHLA